MAILADVGVTVFIIKNSLRLIIYDTLEIKLLKKTGFDEIGTHSKSRQFSRSNKIIKRL